MDDSNKFSEENFRNLTRITTPPEFEGVAGDVITKCISTISSELDTKDQPECNIYPLKITMCVKNGLIDSCPTELQDTSERCVKRRAKGNKDDKAD